MAPKSDQPNVVSGPTAPAGQSAFCRRPTDRRLVRQVLGPHVAPSHWVPMDLSKKIQRYKDQIILFYKIDTFQTLLNVN